VSSSAPRVPERCYPGQRLHDSYQLIELIGRGGMGEVWSARHLRLGAKGLAVKVIYHTEPTLLDRLRREAMIMGGSATRTSCRSLTSSRSPAGSPLW